MSLLAALLVHHAFAGDLVLRDTRGRTIRPEADTTLVFWSMDCLPCLAELRAAAAGPSPVLAVSTDAASSASRLTPYLHSVGIDLPVVPDPTGDLSRRFDVGRAGTVVGLTPNGALAWRREPGDPVTPVIALVTTTP